jgi:hypothetical protein
MSKKSAVFLVALVLFPAEVLLGQVNYGGYLSFEAVKGQSGSEFPEYTLENIQAGVVAGGQAATKFGFALEIRARSVSVFDLEQAWVGFLPSQAISIKAGLFLVPFGLFNRANRPHESPFIRVPLNLAEAYPSSWRELGLCVEGRIGVVTYAAYIGNGLEEGEMVKDGQLFRDNNTDKGKGGRLGLIFSNALMAGVSYYDGKYDAAGERRLTLSGVDLTWMTPEWEVKGEYTKAVIENPDPFEDGRAEGFTVWTSMFLGNFRPIGSFQKLDYDDPFHGPGFVPGAGPGAGVFRKLTRWTAGLRFVPGPGVTITIEYDWNTDKELPLKDDVFQIQAAFSF